MEEAQQKVEEQPEPPIMLRSRDSEHAVAWAFVQRCQRLKDLCDDLAQVRLRAPLLSLSNHLS